jgi:predicted HTH domain antitoxin
VKFLLDTHSFLWFIGGHSKLSPTARALIEETDNQLLLSKASLWEMAIQHWVALELFRMRKISAGKAAQVAEMSLHDFMDLTRQHNIAWIDYTDNELEAELGQVASQNPAFDSLNDLEEDIYSLADGEPFRDQAP